MAECDCFNTPCWEQIFCDCCCDDCPRPCDGTVCVTLSCDTCNIELVVQLTSTCCFDCDGGSTVTHLGVGEVTATVKSCEGDGSFGCDFGCDFETSFDCSSDVTIKVNGMTVDDMTSYSATAEETLTVTADISTTPDGAATCTAESCEIPTSGLYKYDGQKITLNMQGLKQKKQILQARAKRAIARRMQALIAKKVIAKRRAI